MGLKYNLKRYLPLVVAVVLYALFALTYFSPQLSGEVLSQGDVRQYRGMTQEILKTREAVGEDPQWSGSMFSGMPAYLINVEYPSQIIKRWVGGVTNLIDTPAAFIFFAMLSMWLMLVMMGVGGYVAIVGGAMYGLSTYFFLIIGAGHITKMWALVYAPLLMGAVSMTLRGNRWWGAAWAALFASLEIGANHPQISYYFLLAAAFYWISELYFAYRESGVADYLRRTGLLCVAGVLGVLSNFSPLWYTLEHTPETMRGGSELVAAADQNGNNNKNEGGLDLEYATAWSYGKAESFNLLIPDFTGRDSAHGFSADGAVAQSLAPYQMADVAEQIPAYWGGQPFTAGPTYLGAVVIFLACVGFGLSRGRERWWIVAVSVFMLLLAWGSNLMWFTELMFKILPGYNKFRTVSMTLVVVEWTVPLLATFALWRLWQRDFVANVWRVIAYSLAVTVGLSLVVMSFSGSLFEMGYRDGLQMLLQAQFPNDLAVEVASAMVAERAAMIWSDGWRTIIFILLTAGCIAAYLREYLRREVMLVVCGVLAVVDLGGVALRFLSSDDFVSPSSDRFVATAADKEILADRGEVGYRVLNLTVSPFNDASTSYFHRSVGGYHGAKLARYQDVIDRYLSRGDSAVIDMLNTRYVIVPSEDRTSREVLKRETALGAAWFVDGATVARTPNEQISRLAEVDLSRTAVVESDKDVEGLKFSGGEIELVEYQPHHLTYRYSSEQGGVALFSEVYYNKGWRAYVDGVEMPYFRANYILRAMSLPEGEHTVEWRFRAPRWGLIEGVTLIASILILLSILILVVIKYYGDKQKT